MKGHGSKIIKLVSAPSKVATNTGHVGHICYVDDSRTSAFVTRKILAEYGYKVDYFKSAEPAIVAVLEKDYDLLLTDLTLSTDGMDGDELVRFVRKSGHPRKKQIPIVVITGSSDKDTLLRIYEAGANSVLIKPINGEELNDRIRSLVSTKVSYISKASSSYALEIQDASNKGVIPQRRNKRIAPAKLASNTVKKKLVERKPTMHATQKSIEEHLRKIRSSTQKMSGGQQIKNTPQTVQSNAALITKKVNRNISAGVSPKIKRTRVIAKNASTRGLVQAADTPTQNEQLTAKQRASNKRNMAAIRALLRERKRHMATRNEIPTLSSINPNARQASSYPPPSKRAHRLVEQSTMPLMERAGQDNYGRDKKPISSIDADNDFSHLEDEFYQPSMANSVFQVIGRYKILSVAAIVSIAIIGGSLWNYFTEKDSYAVQTVRVGQGKSLESIIVPGKIVSTKRTNIEAPITGEITKLYVDEGTKVNQGQLLATIENVIEEEIISVSNDNFLSAEEELTIANNALRRLRRAFTLGAASVDAIEEAEANLQLARARQSVTKQKTKSTQRTSEKFDMTAPFSGTVISVIAEVGESVNKSETVFKLVDDNKAQVKVRVNSPNSSSLATGQRVTLYTDLFPDLSWTESIIRVVAGKRDTVTAFVTLGDDAPDLDFSQQVEVELSLSTISDDIKLPYTALINRNGKNWVSVVRGGRVHYVPVVTGSEDLTHIEIIEGVLPGDEVILADGKILQEGDRVRITSSRAAN